MNREKVFHNNEQESKQTHNAHITSTSIFCFPSFETVKSICLFFQMKRRKVFHKSKQESKQTHKTNSLPSSASHASKNRLLQRTAGGGGLPNTNKQEQTNSRNKSLHLPSSASCASKPSKADLSLHSDEQEKVFHIQGLPQEKTREQTNPQNKSLPSSASHASKPSKPIYLFIQ